jgi:hypothetical protein
VGKKKASAKTTIVSQGSGTQQKLNCLVVIPLIIHSLGSTCECCFTLASGEKDKNNTLPGIKVLLLCGRIFDKRAADFSVHRYLLYELLLLDLFVCLAYPGKDIVFRFIIEYSSLMDFGPYVIKGLFLYEDF